MSDPHRRDTATFVLLSAVTLFAHVLSYINDTQQPSILKLVSIVAACGSAYNGLRSALSPPTPLVENVQVKGKADYL